MIIEIKVPEVGESITEGVLVEWHKADGDWVQEGDQLYELETDKITMSINAEHSGRLKIKVHAGAEVEIGQKIAEIDTAAAGETESREETPVAQPVAEPTPEPKPAPAPVGEEVLPAPTPQPRAEPVSLPQQTSLPVVGEDGPPITTPSGLPTALSRVTQGLSPAVRRMVDEFKLDVERIAGSGPEGRITKEDVIRFLRSGGAATSEKLRQESAPPSTSKTPTPAQTSPSKPVKEPEVTQATDDTPRQTRKPMSSLRKRIADRLVQVQQTSAILTTFNEVDVSAVNAWRTKYKEGFKAKHGVGLGFMSFFVKATVDALKAGPGLNAQIQGDEIVENHFYDIGIAVGSDRGLVVPVIRDADKKSFAEIEQNIADLAKKVRTKTITLDELSGGVFTISNGGVYGSLLSTPILNPPQSGILGMHGIKKRPVVVDDEIVIRPMMYLALSYDHRIVDGSEAVTFLKRIVHCVENPERMWLEL